MKCFHHSFGRLSAADSGLIIRRLDRLVRDLRNQLNFMHDARKNGLQVIFADKDYSSSPGGEMMMQIEGMFAEQERRPQGLESKTIIQCLLNRTNGQAALYLLAINTTEIQSK